MNSSLHDQSTMKPLYILFVVVFLLMYIVPLGVRPIARSDEARYAEIPREMIVSGNWIAPYLNGFRYFEKPVFGYWTTGVSILLLGLTSFAIRLPSVLAVALSAWCVYRLMRREGDEPGLALLGAAMLITFPLVYMIGITCVLDSLFAGLVTATLMSFYCAATSEGRRGRQVGWLLLTGVLAGLAFMTKGFVAFAVMGLAAGCWLLWERRWKQMVTLPWLPLLAMLAVCLPWGILVHRQEPDYWHYFFWVEHINRFLSPHGNRQHSEPFWYFIPVLLGGVFPWLVSGGAMVLGWKKQRKIDSLTRFCLGWFVLGFLFFSASSGKLGTYILPLMPPLAILAARGLWRYLADKGYAAFKYGGLILVNVLILLLVALFANALWAIPRPFYGSGEFMKWVLACEGVVFWAAMILFAARKSTSWKKRMVYFAVGPTLFMMNFSLVFPRWALDDYSAIAFLRQHTHRVQAEDMVFSDNYLVPSVNLVYERNDVYLLDGRGEFRYALGYEDSKHRRLSKDEFIELLARPAGERKPIVLVIKMHRYDDIKDRLPEPIYYDIGENYVFLRY